jgi:HEAT repeat protein
MSSPDSYTALLTELTSGDEERAEAAARRLAAAGEAALPALEPLLQSDESDQRWWAVRTVAQMDAPRREWLVRALGDPSAEVRAAAALGLSNHPVAEAASALVNTLQDDDSVVAILAVNALIAIGHAAVPAVLETYPKLDPRGRIQAMRALASLVELRDGAALHLMMKAMEGDSAMLRYWAGEGLERVGLNMVYIKPE